ncbi:hypothetical protein, partial [Pseudovibrio flavus]|uniref:hypothetical protein n=1 Tax=Pseudovibrio flavus TaxID=2529854 RepID=UPI00211B8B11
MLLLFALAATPTLAQNYDQACRKLEGEYISLSQQLRSGNSGRSANEAYKRQLDNIRQIEDQEARLGCHSSFSPPYQCANMANAKQAMYNNLNKLAAEVEMNGQHILRDRLQAVEQALFNMNCSGRANSNTTYATGTAPAPNPSYGGAGRP